MQKKYLYLASLLALTAIAATGCKKKEEAPAMPTEQTLTAVTVNDLQAGSYYVKNAGDFYELPLEGISFDATKAVTSTDDTGNGMTRPEENRIVDYVYKDGAIPTMYKNDQLVFKSNGNVPSFVWERFIDQGYSLGVYGLSANSAGKVQFSQDKSGCEANSSIVQALMAQQQAGYDISNGFVIDKINGTSITKDNLRTGGIVAGLTKDAVANCDAYIGTTLVSINATADTQMFTSFELYTTEDYSNSPDGYAIVTIPDYLKSGYYLINNAGLVKYYDVERGGSTGDIDMKEPYYYTGKDGKTLTYYEYQEETGKTNGNTEVQASTLEATNDVITLNTDSSQNALNFSISYQYHTPEDETKAKQHGNFPKIVMMSPTGTATQLAVTQGSGDESDMYYATATIDGAVAGSWELRFYNFEDIYRTISTDVSSGNAKSYIQSGSHGSLNIYLEASDVQNDITVTWQNKDHAAKVEIVTPSGERYSEEATPSNLFVNEYGKQVFRLPRLEAGNYTINVNGSDLGRVWVDNTPVGTDAAPITDATQPAEAEAETEAATQVAQ